MSYFTIGYGMIPTASPAEVKQAVEEIAPSLIDDKMGDYAKKTEVAETLQDYATQSDISDFVTTNQATQIASNKANEVTSQAFTDKEESGNSNDIRTYAKYDKFPGNTEGTPGEIPVAGVEYVDALTGREYIWNGSKYVILNEHETVDVDELNWDE